MAVLMTGSFVMNCLALIFNFGSTRRDYKIFLTFE